MEQSPFTFRCPTCGKQFTIPEGVAAPCRGGDCGGAEWRTVRTGDAARPLILEKYRHGELVSQHLPSGHRI